MIENCWCEQCEKRPNFTEIVLLLEELHKSYPSRKKASTWSDAQVNAFAQAASSTKKKRTLTKVQERRKYSKEIKDTLLTNDELELLLLTKSPKM